MPVDRAGCYVPGGRAPLASSVLMTAVPARVAGVRRGRRCARRRGADGTVHDAILAAAALAGVDEVYRVGGAQAIAAMAYGTETIRAGRRDRRPGQRVRRRGEAPGRRPSSGSTASRARRRSRSSPTTPSTPCGSRPTCSRRPSTAPAARWRSSPGTTTSPTRSSSRSTRCSRSRDAARRGRGDARAGRARRARRRSRRRRSTPPNAIAPEHLELMCADAELLVPLVRNAGAVFVGAYAPAVIGDYVAGVNHVLPDRRHRAVRERAARRRLPEAHARRLARRGRAARASRRYVHALAEAEGLAAHADAVRAARGARRERPRVRSRATTCARSRATTRRRSTSTCGSTPTRARTRRRPRSSTRWLDALRDGRLEPLSRSRRDRAARTRSARSSASRPSGCSAANGSNEVLQTLLLTYGGAGRRALMFEPTYALHAHIARITGTEVVAGERAADYTIDVDAAAELIATARSRRSCSSAARTTRPAPSRPRETVERLLDARRRARRAARRRRGVRRVRAVERARARRRRSRPLVVVRTYSKVWSLAAVRLGFAVAPDVGGRRAREGAAAVQPVGADAGRGHGRARLPRRDGAARRGARRGARPAVRRARRAAGLAGRARRAPTSCLFRVDGDAHDAVGSGCSTRGVLVRDFSSWPRRRGVPPRHGRHARRERRVPRRARRGPPGGRDMTTGTPSCSRETKETTVDVDARRRRHRRDARSSTGIPFFDHMLEQLGKHARLRPRRSTRRATSRSTCTTRSKTSASCSATRCARRSATRRGVRRFANALVPLDEALVQVALDLSGRPFLVYDVDPVVGVDRHVRSAARRGVLEGLRRRRARHAAPAQRHRARTATT